MHSTPDKIRKILDEHGIDLDGDGIPDLVMALDEYADECAEMTASDARTEAAFDEGEIRIETEDAVRAEVASEIEANLSAYLRLAKTDPDSAAVYFHRATGKHIFEVEQPCLL